MDVAIFALVVLGLISVGFVAGVVFHKFAISEVVAAEARVTVAVRKLAQDSQSSFDKASADAQKLHDRLVQVERAAVGEIKNLISPGSA